MSPPPTQHGTFVSRFGYFATEPIVSVPNEEQASAPCCELAVPTSPDEVNVAYLYWSWKAACIRPGHDLVRVGGQASVPVGGQAVGWRCDPIRGDIDLVVYRADITRLLRQRPSARHSGGRRFSAGLEVQRDRAQPGESAQCPTLVILRDRPGTAITWLFDGASARRVPTDTPFSGLDACTRRGFEYVLASPLHAPARAASWTNVAVAGTRRVERDIVTRRDHHVEVASYDVSGCLDICGQQTELAVGVQDASRPRGSTFTSLFDLLWINTDSSTPRA